MKRNDANRNQMVIEGTRIGIWDWNIQTGETFFNARWAEIIGYTIEELSPVSIDTWIKYAHPDDLKESNKRLEDHFNKKVKYYDFQSRMKHKNGNWIWVHDRGKVFEWDEKGNPLRMCGSHIDITEIKQLELNLKKSNNEKDVLLNEVHHRVKNNLQLITSLLKIEQRKTKNKEVKSVLISSRQRIEAITFIHQTLYNNSNLANINTKKYLYDIAENLFFSANTKNKIQLNISSNLNTLSADVAINLGLITAELITNSIKHGYQNDTANFCINIKISKQNSYVDYLYTDNGLGLNSELELQNSSNFGFKLISHLIKKLDGNLIPVDTGKSSFKMCFNFKYILNEKN
ncbi:MAG: PAS domain-containing protein [Saprospiraceae bacterium]|nr:PAS domain-containing protein [Saprospiraceae bacterium]